MKRGAPRGTAPVAAAPRADYDGEPVAALRERLGVPALFAYAHAPSTMDLAHGMAARGTAAGTVVVSDVQTAGRGRNGRRWVSDRDAGVWATVVERPDDPSAFGVLSLRVGLELAAELEQLVGEPTRIKWPNDILLGTRKLGGVLVEARWRDGVPEWVAIGVGVNRTPPPEMTEAVGTGPSVSRHELLGAVVRAVRAAAARRGHLGSEELAHFDVRDAVRGREVIGPAAGYAQGVSPRGELLVRGPNGIVHAVPTATVQYRDAW